MRSAAGPDAQLVLRRLGADGAQDSLRTLGDGATCLAGRGRRGGSVDLCVRTMHQAGFHRA